MLAKKGGFVYYEADCTIMATNPFIDINSENVWQANAQSKPLKVGDKELVIEVLVEHYYVYVNNLNVQDGSIHFVCRC